MTFYTAMGGHRANGPAPAQEVIAPMQGSSSQSSDQQTPAESLRHALMYLDAARRQVLVALNQLAQQDEENDG
jgi:hypothetical protein